MTQPSPPQGRARAGLEPDRHNELHAELDAWRANVGGPVAIDGGPAAPAALSGIDVISWNVAIGQGRLDELLARLRTTTHESIGSVPGRPLVILAQEAYRSDATVPGAAGTRHHGGKLAERRRSDIVEVAQQHGLSLRYSPSMRNGSHGSDRGNAILASVRLGDAHAFLLPYVRQRRVAVSAQLAGHSDITFVSAHLDTHGREPDARSRRLGAGRAAQARALGRTIAGMDGSAILGADLNSLLGMTDPAVHELVEAGLHPARRIGTWTHTFHRPLRLLLDHVLFRSPDYRVVRVSVVRIDEVEGDRSRTVFGSDHHPLLARVDLDAS